MKKNLIIYIVAGVIVVGGLTTGGIIAAKKLNKNDDGTTASTQAAFEEDFGQDGYTVVEEPSEEFVTDEDGNIIELYTDEEGNTYEAVVATDANGAIVTDANGEKVTSTKTPSSVKPTKPSTTKKASSGSSGIANGTKVDSNSTVKINDDGSASIVKSDGTVALSYSYSEKGNYFYTDDNPWQRNMGFNRLYDMGAAFTVMYYDTIRIKYTDSGYDWMVQMWKGQYGLIFIGSEIGLYYKETSKSTDHYNCATEKMELNMQMTLYREGYGELFTRPYASHWWTTAFVPGKLKKFSDRSELTMVGKIEFNSVAEREKFCAALSKCTDIDGNKFKHVSSISKNNPETYTYRDKTVDFVWRFFDADRKTSTKVTTTKKPATTKAPTQTEAPTTAKPTTPITTAPVVVEPDPTTETPNPETPSVD